MAAFELSLFIFALFVFKSVLSAQMVHTRGIQLVSGLSLKAADTFYKQCRHLGHLHKDM